MDHASFALRQQFVVLHQAGIRHLLPGPEASAPDILSEEPWPALLEKIPQGAASIWTYEGLGQDLTGKPSAERRGMLGKLLGLMRLPKGYVGFLPFSLPGGSVQRLMIDHFMQALSLLHPSSVVYFGVEGGCPFQSSFGRPESSSALGCTLQLLPDLSVLLQMNEADLLSVSENLKSSIFRAPC